MAVINGFDVNKNFIDKIFMEIKKLYVPKESGIPDLKLVGDNLFIRPGDLVLYNNYREMARLLSFSNKDSSELYFFSSFAIKVSDFDTFYKIAYGSDLYSRFADELKEMDQYGIMPGYQYNAPIPRQKNQSIEEYEKYLEGYYGKHGYVVSKDSDGIRKPYPHELFKWSRGIALSRDFNDYNYVSPYYKDLVRYLRSKNSNVQSNNNQYGNPYGTSQNNNNNNQRDNSYSTSQNNNNNNQRDNSYSTSQNNNSGYSFNQSSQSTTGNSYSQQVNQNASNPNRNGNASAGQNYSGKRKYKVKSKTSFGTKAWDTFMGAQDSVGSFRKHFGNSWPSIKAKLKRPALVALGIGVGVGVAAIGIAAIIKATEIPSWIAITKPTGTVTPKASIIAGIILEILGRSSIILIPAALIIAYKLLRKRWKKNKEIQHEQAETPSEPREFRSIQDISARIAELNNALQDLEKRKTELLINNGDQKMIGQINEKMKEIREEQKELLNLLTQFSNTQTMNSNNNAMGGPTI